MPLRLHGRTRKRPHLGGPGRREGPGCPRPIWSIPITAIRIGEPAGQMSRLYGAANRRRLPHCVGLRLAPAAMTAPAPAIVMTVAATSHVTVAVSMTAARENHRTVGASDQRLRRNPGHGRSG